MVLVFAKALIGCRCEDFAIVLFAKGVLHLDQNPKRNNLGFVQNKVKIVPKQAKTKNIYSVMREIIVPFSE